MKPIQFDLPLPPRCLHPNARAHWAQKAKATRKTRAESALVARLHAPKRPWHKATVQLTFHKRTAQRADADNLLASCKAVFDGLQDAGIVADDAMFTHLPVRQQKADAQGPRLTVLIFKEGDH